MTLIKPSMKVFTAAFLMISPLLFLSCIPGGNKDGIICTTEYRMLNVSIKDTSGQPVRLNSYFVKKTSTGEIIDLSKESPYTDSVNRIQGIYFLFTDGKMGLTAPKGSEFEFHGILEGMEIVNEKYIIGNDRCHIQLISGKTEIVILR